MQRFDPPLSTRLSRALAAMIPAAALMLAGCATSVNPVSGRVDRGLMSEEQEIRSGQLIDQEVRKEYTPYNNPALQAYVNAVGQRLSAQSHRASLPWKFTVVDSPEINAFAVQGGFIYITRGLLAYLDSEAELAGVLGHEIGHVTARHGARADHDQKAIAGATVLGTIIAAAAGYSRAAELINEYGAPVAQASFLLPRSREHELQADQLGAEYLQRVNFDPDVMIRVIGVLRAQEVFARDEARALGRNTDETPNWLRTHPSNDQRLADIKRIAAQYTGKYQDEGRGRYLQAINGMTFGDSREHGVTRGQSFYHEPLGFTLRAPTNWQFQNAPNELGVLANDMSAAVSMRPSPQSRGDHNAAIRNLLAPDQGRTEAATINGLRATNFIGSKQGRSIDATVITLGNLDYVFVKMQKAEARGSKTNALRDIVASFRAMTAADRENAEPYKLRTVPLPKSNVPSTTPWAELARDVSRIAPHLRNPEAQLRLLNQVYPQGTIAAGQLVKVIQ